jgi:hypothetical protein
VIPVIAAWLAITGVTVIDVHSGARRPGSTVLIRDNRIDAVGAPARDFSPARIRRLHIAFPVLLYMTNYVGW